MRTCTTPACDKQHRARGLCSTHYNQQHQPMRHAPIEVACVVCGVIVKRGNKSSRRHVCSRDCWRTLVGYTQGYDVDGAAADRARKAGAFVITVFSLEAVLDRDDWSCRMCGIELSRDPDWAPSMATVDHIVPLSRGGSHTVANAQAACLRCNSAKHDRLDFHPLVAGA